MTLLSFLFAVLAALGAKSPAQAQSALSSALTRIGAAGAVHGKVQATAPNTSVGRVLESGKEVFLNDHVTTNADGHLQVLLLDETVFTLGPDADMVLDEFVYDPKTSAGKVSAQVVKGAFRFVTGKVARAHPADMKVGLAVGTIGVRGTVVLGETGPRGSTVVNAGAGPENNGDERPSAIVVSNSGVTRTVDLTGDGVTIAPGQAPSFPRDMTADIDRISRLVELPPNLKPSSIDPMHADATTTSGEILAESRALAIGAAQEEQYGDQNSQQQVQAQQLQYSGNQSQSPAVTTVWSEMTGLTGSGSYVASGNFNQTQLFGSPSNVNGTWDYNVNVNFNSQTITGSAAIDTSSHGGSISDSVVISQGFGNSGNATFNQNSSNGQYSFTFKDQGGTIAKQLVGTSSYNDGGGNVGVGSSLTSSR